MSHEHEIIRGRVDRACSQWKRLLLLKGLAKLFVFTLLGLLAAFALDAFLNFAPAVRQSLLGLVAVLAVLLFYGELVRPLRKMPTRDQMARFLEEQHPHLQDRLVTAIEMPLSEGSQESASKSLFDKLIEDTRFHIDPLNLTRSIKSRSSLVWGNIAVLLFLVAAGVFFANMPAFRLRTNRLIQPWDYPKVTAKPSLLVKPGNARVQTGLPQQISAELTGLDAQSVVLYYSPDDSTWNKVEMDLTNRANIFVFNLFDLQTDTRYYVKAGNEISDIFEFNVFAAPRITRVDLSYNFPGYTGLSSRKEIDSGDIWAPEGTTVTIKAYADKALKSAGIVVAETHTLKTSVVADSVVTARLKVNRDTFYKIHITGIDGLENASPPEYYVHALPDQPPSLTIERPARDVRATMLEELPIRVSIQDDYGVPVARLKYVINSSDEKEVKLSLRATSPGGSGLSGSSRNFSARHLFYLEDLQLKPGDFLGYYVETGDVNTKSESIRSDIFFIEIRPFEAEFTRPLSQGQAGGSSPGGRLSQTQKEIIVATWKTQQKKSKLDAGKLKENVAVLVESQKNLQDVTQSTLMQIEQRSTFTRDTNKSMTSHYAEAVKAMDKALTELSSGKLGEAQGPQRDALQRLLQAEAQIRQVQVQQSRGQAGGSNSALDELSQLFEKEMDKLKNKYETLNQARQTPGEEAVNEALNKVKELADRQQKFNRQMQNFAKNDLKEEEKKRKIKELRREQEQIQSETQALSRKIQQAGGENKPLPRQVQDDLRRATSEMSNASHNLQNDNTELAATKGTRALNRLNRLEDLLQRNQKASSRRQVNELEEQFQELTRKQRGLTRDVETLSAAKGQNADALTAAERQQENLREGLKRAGEQVKSLQTQAQHESSELSNHIRKLGQKFEKDGIGDKMQVAQELLKKKRFNSAFQAEKDILSKLERSSEQLTKIRGALSGTEEEKLGLALEQTRRLREQLESLQQQTKKLSEAGNKDALGESPSNRAGQQNRINEDLARSLKEIKQIEQSLQADSSLAKTAGGLNQSMRGLLKSFGGGAPGRMQFLEQRILFPLKGLEAELAQKLELLRSKEKFFIAREEKVPQGYEELVEKYYEALSKNEK